MSKDFFRSSILPYVGIIVKICRAYTDSQEDFEDYYQEVCLQVWRSKDNFKEKAEWSTWIYKLTLNVCLTLQKKKPPMASLDRSLSVNDKTERSAFDQDDIHQLYAAIKQLSAIDRAVILLYLEEKSYRQIAEIIGTNPTNIGVRITRIKKRLKKLLDGKIN